LITLFRLLFLLLLINISIIGIELIGSSLQLAKLKVLEVNSKNMSAFHATISILLTFKLVKRLY
jgi:hypothetical protein